MIRDRLVATGVPAADTFLRAGLALLPAEVREDSARAAWLRAEQLAEKLAGFRGSAERLQRAEKAYDERRRELATAARAERRAREVAHEANPGAAAAVEGELIAFRCDYHDRRDEHETSVEK